MFLGIDIGTSAVKAVVANPDGEVLATSHAPLSVQSPRPGWNEQDPEDWWRAVAKVCADLRARTDFDAIGAIGLSGQMHGAVCVDRDGRPLRPAILWNDGRSTRQCLAMQRALPEVGSIAGAPPMPGFTAPKLLWLSENEPEIHRQIAHILLPKDFVRLKLTGGFVTDMADAAGTHWLDQAERRWSRRLCRISATDPAWLPDCVEGTAMSGQVTREAADTLGVRAEIPVAGGGGDAAAGAVGIGAIRDGDAFISLGTSGQLFTVTDRYRPDPDRALHAYAHCIPDTWFQMAAMLNGASPIAWWSKASGAEIPTLLGEAKDADAEHVPTFLPYLTGERTPHNDADIRGGFYGLTGMTGRAEMTRAVLDAIAYSFCDAAEALSGAGSRIAEPAAIGGGARSDLLLQTISDALGVAIRRYRDADTGPALGAARLAMVASGTAGLTAVATKPETDRVFEPDPKTAARHRSDLERYRSLYRTLRPFAAS